MQGRSIIPYFLCVWGHVAYFCLIGEARERREKGGEKKKRGGKGMNIYIYIYICLKGGGGESGFRPTPLGLLTFIVFIYLFRNVSHFNDYISIFVAFQLV